MGKQKYIQKYMEMLKATANETKMLIWCQKCHSQKCFYFCCGGGGRKYLSFPWISFSLRSLTNTCCNTIKMEGYMNRNLNKYCLILLHGKHMLRGKGDKNVHKCMMPHCSELSIKIHTFNRSFVNFLGIQHKKEQLPLWISSKDWKIN